MNHREVGDPASLPTAPLVSIFVVAYEHESWLEQCIDSIAAQRADFPYEIVIAEDCSADRTRETALALQRRYPHLVRVAWTGENKGGAGNTLFGISLCRGELIGCCEGDDFWIDEEKLARQVAALRAHPEVDLSFTGGYRLNPDGTRHPEWDWGPEPRILSASELHGTLGWPAPSASLLFRGEVLRNLPPWYGRSSWGDLVLTIAGSVRGGAHYDPHRTICYRVGRPNSFTAREAQRPRAEKIDYLKGAIGHLLRTGDHYGVPRQDLMHRIDDYRLSLAKLQLAEGRLLAAAGSFAAIRPSFLAKGVARRLRRAVSRA